MQVAPKAAALFLFHAAATEFLPRYGLPLLPSAWAAAATLGATLVQYRRELDEAGEGAAEEA